MATQPPTATTTPPSPTSAQPSSNPLQTPPVPPLPSTSASPQPPIPLDPNTPYPSPILHTKRHNLPLRSMHPRDAPSMAEACAPASITEYMTLRFAHPYTLQHAETWIAFNLKDKLPNYVVVLPKQGKGEKEKEKEKGEAEGKHTEQQAEPEQEIIGGIGLKRGDDVHSHCAELGYWLAEPHWGKGYMTDVLSSFIAWVFDAHVPSKEKGELDPREEQRRTGAEGITRIWAGVFSGNKASMTVLERCGFVREGVLREHVNKRGMVCDLHVFGLGKREWLERQAG